MGDWFTLKLDDRLAAADGKLPPLLALVGFDLLVDFSKVKSTLVVSLALSPQS